MFVANTTRNTTFTENTSTTTERQTNRATQFTTFFNTTYATGTSLTQRPYNGGSGLSSQSTACSTLLGNQYYFSGGSGGVPSSNASIAYSDQFGLYPLSNGWYGVSNSQFGFAPSHAITIQFGYGLVTNVNQCSGGGFGGGGGGPFE